jgi:hypothetical protein
MLDDPRGAHWNGGLVDDDGSWFQDWTDLLGGLLEIREICRAVVALRSGHTEKDDFCPSSSVLATQDVAEPSGAVALF